MTPISYHCKIIECEKISPDVYLITLEAPGKQCFCYLPGQYLFIKMAENDARPYSIASVPEDGRRLQMHLKDIPDNEFTSQVLQRLKTDSHINIQLASGACTIDCSDGIKPLLFIAGGTGFAHCHSIILSLLSIDDSRSIALYWGANFESEIYLQETARQWMKDHANFTFVPVVSSDDNWTGETGMVHEAVFRNISRLEDYDIYLSGSSAMVFNIYRQLRDKNVPSAQIYSDMLDILREKKDLDADLY